MAKPPIKKVKSTALASKTGPKTPAGRSAVSKNAITHGITSARLTTSQQEQEYHDFIAELTDHYQPESPLERLQIERIAMLRAKLRHLYEVEGVLLKSASLVAENDLERVFRAMPHIQGVTKGMLREILTFGETRLPCGLTPEVLGEILVEVDSFSGELKDDEGLRRYLPKLADYVEGVDTKEGQRSLLHRLVAVAGIIKRATLAGEGYCEHATYLMKSRQLAPEPIDEHALELDRYIEEQNAKRGAKKDEYGFSLQAMLSNIMPEAKDVQGAIHELRVLANAYVRAVYHVDEAVQIMELRTQSVTLDAEDADRFLRYQITLERRLSVLLGELLHMQEKKARPARD